MLGSLNLEKHPDKTFIGRIERGFDFLGYHFRPDRLSMAAKTIENFVARATRLYEQEPGGPVGTSRLGLYVHRWLAWLVRGLVSPAEAGAATVSSSARTMTRRRAFAGAAARLHG